MKITLMIPLNGIDRKAPAVHIGTYLKRLHTRVYRSVIRGFRCLGNSVTIVEKVVLIHHQISFLKPRVFLDKKTQPENTISVSLKIFKKCVTNIYIYMWIM